MGLQHAVRTYGRVIEDLSNRVHRPADAHDDHPTAANAPTSPVVASTPPSYAPLPRRSLAHRHAERQLAAVRSNLGIGHDLRASLMNATP